MGTSTSKRSLYHVFKHDNMNLAKYQKTDCLTEQVSSSETFLNFNLEIQGNRLCFVGFPAVFTFLV